MKPPFKILIILLFFHLFLCPVSIFAQSKSFHLQKTEKHLSVVDGLSNRQINATFIDKNKNIWFLTDNKIGLFEFGKINNFLLSETFSNRGFNSAYEDNGGNFWVSENFEWYYPFNVQRCIIFNPITRKAIPLEKYIPQKIAIHSIISDAQHQIFVGTKTGQIYRFDIKNHLFQLISSFAQMPVKLLHAGSKGLIACLEKNDKIDKILLQLDSNGKLIMQTDLKGQFVRSILEVDNRLFYIIPQNEKITLREIGASFKKHFSISHESYLGNILYDKAHQFFVINEGNALSFFDKKFNFVLREKYNFLIQDLIQDVYGNFILSTNNGVHIVKFDEKKIRTFLENAEPEKLNENFSCRKILKTDNNQIIVNTNKKRQLIDLKTFKIIPLNDVKSENIKSFGFVLSSLKDKSGALLFGEDELVTTDIQTMKNEILCSFDNIKIWAITEYKNGYLLGLERKGIIYYDKKTKQVTTFFKDNPTFETSIVYDFLVNEDKIYIASEAGFYQWSSNNPVLKKIYFPLKANLQMTCFSLQRDKKNQHQLLLATLNGIWIYDLLTHRILPFLQEKKYEYKKYFSAYRTKNGVWASTEEGIWHFNDKGNLMKIYTVADGLTSNECNRLSHFQDENDVLYFGGINGLNILNPSDFSTKMDKKFTMKTACINTYRNTIKNRVLVNFNDKFLKLNRGENSLELTFSYEDFKYNCDKKYYYRTDRSLTKDWQVLFNRRLLLSNVEYGTTNIEIMVVSCDDFLNADTKKITISRQNPLYLTWYFWIILLIILSVLTFGIIKYFTYQLKHRNQILQRKVEEQTLSLQESLNLKETLLGLLIHDVRYPVQSFYGITKKMSYLIKKNDIERLLLLGNETENKSRKVLWLIDELVYWVKSTNTNFKLDCQECHFGELIKQIFEIYHDELNEKSLHYTISNAEMIGNIDQGLFVIVMRNLIFNAVIHSKACTIIQVVIELSNDNYNIIITNKFQALEEGLEKGMGVGMMLLLPILEKANFKVYHTQTDDNFTNKLSIHLDNTKV